MIRVYFYDDEGRLLYDADLPAVPREGDEVRFPSGKTWRVNSRAVWIVGERAGEHNAQLLVTALDEERGR